MSKIQSNNGLFSQAPNAYRGLRIASSLIVVVALAACVLSSGPAFKRDQQMRFDQALDRCEQGFTAYCQQVANGGNYAH